MKKKDIFSLISRLQHILRNKPSENQMLQEVQMMKFKIRPVLGDISLLNFKNNQLIEALWGLGKLDEFFRSQFKDASVKEQKVFFQMVSQLRTRLENQLNKIRLKKPAEIPQLIEMEIFKEYPKKEN